MCANFWAVSVSVEVSIEIRQTASCRLEIERCAYRRIIVSPVLDLRESHQFPVQHLAFGAVSRQMVRRFSFAT